MENTVYNHRLMYSAYCVTIKKNRGGNITQYLPIGWTSYSGGYILYELSTGRIFEEDIDNVGIPAKEPLADSLKELIRGLSLKTVG